MVHPVKEDTTMNTQQAVANRIRQLCRARGITPNPGSATVKKLCDALEITLGQFFSTPEFDALGKEMR